MADHPAPAHDRDGIADRHDLAQLVGDQQNADALGRQPPQDIEQPVRLVRRQHACGLVEDQHPRATEKRLQDLHALLKPDRQRAGQRIRVDLQPVLLLQPHQRRARRRPTGPEQDPTFAPQHHVLKHGERRDQHEVLMHHADPVPDRIRRSRHPDRDPVDLERPGIRRIETVEDRH